VCAFLRACARLPTFIPNKDKLRRVLMNAIPVPLTLLLWETSGVAKPQYLNLVFHEFWIEDPANPVTNIPMSTQHGQCRAPQNGYRYTLEDVVKLCFAFGVGGFSQRYNRYTAGHLKIPKGVTVVHADAGDGWVDPLSMQLARAGDGRSPLHTNSAT
jgi:hypothetical protein